MATKRVLSTTSTATPYLAIRGASEAIEFYKMAFGAEETMRIEEADGRIGFAELRIGEAVFFVSDEYLEIHVHSAQRLGDSPVMIVLDVPDVDALFAQAVAAGATIDRPLQDSFNGTLRTAKLVDPYHHRWMITTKYEITE